MKMKYWILMVAVAVTCVAGGFAISHATPATTEWVQICYSLGSDGKTFTEFDLDQLTTSPTSFAKCASGLKQLTIQAMQP